MIYVVAAVRWPGVANSRGRAAVDRRHSAMLSGPWPG